MKKMKVKVSERAVDFQLKLLKAKRNGFMLGLIIGLVIGIIVSIIVLA